MIEEVVRVVEQDGDYVWVEATSRSACGSCGSQNSCGTSVLGNLFKPRKNLMRVVDNLNLQVGEQAIAGMDEMELSKAAFYAYLLPMLLMVAISVSAGSLGLSDAAVLMLGMLGLVAGLQLARFVSKRLPGSTVTVRLLRRTWG
jgi:sigma-E factor negative regulatory protein RseC